MILISRRVQKVFFYQRNHSTQAILFHFSFYLKISCHLFLYIGPKTQEGSGKSTKEQSAVKKFLQANVKEQTKQMQEQKEKYEHMKSTVVSLTWLLKNKIAKNTKKCKRKLLKQKDDELCSNP